MKTIREVTKIEKGLSVPAKRIPYRKYESVFPIEKLKVGESFAIKLKTIGLDKPTKEEKDAARTLYERRRKLKSIGKLPKGFLTVIRTLYDKKEVRIYRIK